MEKWEEEFDRQFRKNGGYLCQYDPDLKAHTSNHEDVRVFIRAQCEQARREGIEEAVEAIPLICTCNGSHNPSCLLSIRSDIKVKLNK